MGSPFDDAWGSANGAIDATAGEWITVNGVDIRGVVSSLESSTRGSAGLLITDNATQIDISNEDATTSGAAKGKIVLAQGRRMRITSAISNGGAGVTLVCGNEEQYTRTPGL